MYSSRSPLPGAPRTRCITAVPSSRPWLLVSMAAFPGASRSIPYTWSFFLVLFCVLLAAFMGILPGWQATYIPGR